MNIWDNQNRIDPGQTGGPPNMWDITGKGQQPAYDPYEDIGAMPRHPQFDETRQSLPLEDTSMDFMDLLDPTMLGKAGKFIGRHAIEGLAGLPAAAGMVKMGGKEFPKAFALRTMDLSAEEPFLRQVLRKELPHDVSGTIVSPAQVGSFGDFDNQYGLLFDVLNDKALKDVAGFDLMAQKKFLENKHPSRIELSPGEGHIAPPLKDIDDLIKNQKSWYNEAILSLGKDTPISGVRIVPKASKFYDPSKELSAVTMARSMNVPIFNIPGIDQLGDFMNFAGKLEKGGATGGRWTKAKGQYPQGVTDTELRSNIWKDLY